MEKLFRAIPILCSALMSACGSATNSSSSPAPVTLPAATSQSVTVAYATATAITLAGVPATVGDSLTYAIGTGPNHGVLSGTAPNLTYTPQATYFGSDSFTFTVTDGILKSAIGTVTMTVAQLQIALTYTASGSPYMNSNIFTDAQNATLANPAWDGATPVTINVTINSGVTIGSSTSTSAALVTNTVGSQTFPTGTVIKVTNKGTISGAGGAGGITTGQSSSGAGGNGGNAFAVSYAVTLTNNGTIGGGGGGGGGGGDDSNTDNMGGCAGGGAGSVIGAPSVNSNGSFATAASATLGGMGEPTDANDCAAGGNGGNLGYAGTAGTTCSTAGGPAGAAGYAIIGTDLINNGWQATGTYLGNNSNTPTGSTYSSGPATTLSIVSGNNQSIGAKGRTLNVPLTVQLTDGGTTPVVGTTVTWTINGNAIAGCTTTTDATGKATCSSVVTGADAALNTIVATSTASFGTPATTFTEPSNSVCTGGAVTAGTTCTSTAVTSTLGSYSSAIYMADLNGYEYILLSSDTGATVKWNASNVQTSATDINYGVTNMSTIMTYATANSYNFNTQFPAASLCYQIGDNGWYLPAKNELALLYQNRVAINAATGVTALSANYWSSTEGTAFTQAYRIATISGSIVSGAKTTAESVRCIRRF